MVRDIFDGEPNLVALLARCSQLYLNAIPKVAQLLACYCALQLATPSPPKPMSAPPTPTAAFISKASAAFGFGCGEEAEASALHEERAAKLRRAMSLIAYLDDKQQFFTPFGASLATRLVRRGSFSVRLEKLAFHLVRHAEANNPCSTLSPCLLLLAPALLTVPCLATASDAAADGPASLPASLPLTDSPRAGGCPRARVGRCEAPRRMSSPRSSIACSPTRPSPAS